MIQEMSDLHVVIGVGTIGSRVARMLTGKGKRVIVVSRTKPNLGLTGVEEKTGDASSLESLLTVASSAKTIYNCANPPYNTWEVEWPKISSSVSEFAMRTGADLVICSNLYGYGPHEGVLTEDFPLKATWANGVARAKVWQENMALNDAGKLRVTEVRGSDYICANEQSRMGDRVVPNLISGKPIQLLGAIDKPHTWTDPDDVAKLMITLAEDDRSWGRPWHVPSNEPKTQREVVADISRELGVTEYKVAPVGIFLESILGLFNPVIRELNRGRYQFSKPYVVSSKAAHETFGHSPKPWQLVIKDLVRPYLKDAEASRKETIRNTHGASDKNRPNV
jgi:nucleoside-diphosphate-sugar epimerase